MSLVVKVDQEDYDIEVSNLNILVRDARWDNILSSCRHSIADIINLVFTAENQDPYLELAIILSHDEEIRQMNNNFRKLDKPTNVLSFSNDDEGILGDVIFSYDTLLKEADEQNKSRESHFAHLLIHGVLHLIGYDHEDDQQAEIMEKKEIALLRGLGFADPYNLT